MELCLEEMGIADIPIQYDWRLNERHYGALQGLNKGETAEKYQNLNADELPAAECLKDTVNRFLPYWMNSIKPDIESGKKVLIVAHGNSLRALVKYLDNISDEDILGLNIPTGAPLVYELNDDLTPIKHYYLGDQEAIQASIQAVANQGKKS